MDVLDPIDGIAETPGETDPDDKEGVDDDTIDGEAAPTAEAEKLVEEEGERRLGKEDDDEVLDGTTEEGAMSDEEEDDGWPPPPPPPPPPIVDEDGDVERCCR